MPELIRQKARQVQVRYKYHEQSQRAQEPRHIAREHKCEHSIHNKC